MSKTFDAEKLAKEYKLTDLQRKFCEYFVYVTGLDGPLAVEMAGYKVDKSEYEGYDGPAGEAFTKRAMSTRARELLDNAKVTKYIEALRTNLDNHLIVDKLWVLKVWKDIATGGSENARLKASEYLGKYLGMFEEKIKIDSGEDAGELARKAFENRMVKFPKEA